MRIDRCRLTVLAALLSTAFLTGCAEPTGISAGSAIQTETGTETDIEIDNARVRSLIPGQDKTVAYLELRNATPKPMTLIGARSAEVRAIEIHTTRMDDGVMRMRRLKTVEIPPGETVHFQPGGRHLMLFGVTSLDSELLIELEFADGTVHETLFKRIAIGSQ
jgi:copper(I)-binding protein